MKHVLKLSTYLIYSNKCPGGVAILKSQNRIFGTNIWAKSKKFYSLKPNLIAFDFTLPYKKWEGCLLET